MEASPRRADQVAMRISQLGPTEAAELLDTLDDAMLGTRPNLSHLAARQEVRNLIDSLRLPIDERGQRRAAARAEWVLSSARPIDGAELIAE